MTDQRDSSSLRGPVRAAIGLLAVAAALAVGHLLAAITGPNSSPYLAVGNTAIDLTPEPVKAFAIQQFGTADKIALLIGMGLVIVVLALVAGLLSRHGPLPGAVVFGVFGAVGIAAALARPDLRLAGSLPAVVAALTGVAVFTGLHRLASRDAADDGSERSGGAGPDGGATPGSSRRRFLVSSGAVALTAGVAGAGGQVLVRRSPVEAARQDLRNLAPVQPAQPIPAGADFASSGTPSFITPNADFYRIDTALSVPQVGVDDWTLRVHGMVDRELVLSFGEMLRRRRVERTITLCCVSNEVGGNLISNATFVGVPIRDVLLEAGVRPGAQQVLSTSVDGFTAGTPVDVLLQPDRDALLAFGMNGQPLPAEHGFPVRMVTPGLYGFVSATKWVTDLELTTFDRQAYWQERGWAQQAPIKTQSRIDRPRPFSKSPAGRTTAAGIAWAQHTGIDRVEVRVDGGPWQTAQLSTEVNADTWRMWRAELDLPPGGHTLECRATDRRGRTQPPQRTPTIPDGATGWHSIFHTAT